MPVSGIFILGRDEYLPLQKITYIISLYSVCTIFAQNWKSHSANILPQKRFEVGLFQPFRYGYNETLEYSTYQYGSFLCQI